MSEMEVICLFSKSAPVEEEPVIRLHRWMIKCETAGDCFFVGFKDDGRRGRISSPIQIGRAV